jgi:hypothetical protein
MALARLGIENSLQICEVYGIVKNITSIIMREFCATIRKHLKPLLVTKLSINRSKKSLLVLKVYMKCFYILDAIYGR